MSNPSVVTMPWIVICDTSISGGRQRYVFSPNDDTPGRTGHEATPMHRAYEFARYHANECIAECGGEGGYAAGSVRVFCQAYQSNGTTYYMSDWKRY